MSATRVQIQCINKEDRYNPYERITHVGGISADRTPWRITQADAIRHVANGTRRFFVRVFNHDVDVVVSVSRFGNKYLKTSADQDTPDNLLSLPECP